MDIKRIIVLVGLLLFGLLWFSFDAKYPSMENSIEILRGGVVSDECESVIVYPFSEDEVREDIRLLAGSHVFVHAKSGNFLFIQHEIVGDRKIDFEAHGWVEESCVILDGKNE